MPLYLNLPCRRCQMNQIPIDTLIWAVKNKDCLAPYEKDAIIQILVEYEPRPENACSIPSNICLSETE
jgi:hypothetical protein